MIFDNIKNAQLYYGLSERIKKGLEFLQTADLASLPVGKQELDGKDLFIAVSEYNTKDVAGDFEAHDKYIDVQYIVSGNERIDYAERALTEETIPYNPEKDVVKIKCGRFIPLSISAGQFAIFFPEDAHRPNVTDCVNAFVKKVVVKVKI